MELTQSYQLLKLIRDANIVNGKISGNSYHNAIKTVSLLGSPQLSGLSLSIYDTVVNNETFSYDYSSSVTGLIPFFDKLNRNIEYKPLYRLFQSVIIESFSLVYSLENFPDYVPNFTQEDANRVHGNIQIIIDNLYTINDSDTYYAIMTLREIDNNIMYLYTTFSGLDYKYSNTSENSLSKVNLIPDSEFYYLDKFWVFVKAFNYTGTSNELKDFVSQYGSSLSFNNINADGVELSTSPIPVYSDTRLTVRYESLNYGKLYAVDKDNNPVRFIDEFGNVINDGLLGSTTQVSDNVQSVKGVYIPGGVSYVKLVIDLYKVKGNQGDTIDKVMMAYGYSIGSYIRSAIYDLQ